jgi:hypothetical protein
LESRRDQAPRRNFDKNVRHLGLLSASDRVRVALQHRDYDDTVIDNRVIIVDPRRQKIVSIDRPIVWDTASNGACGTRLRQIALSSVGCRTIKFG